MKLYAPKQITFGFPREPRPGETVWEVSGKVEEDFPRVFHHQYIVPNLSGAVAPEKALHFHHNRARNELTRAMIEYKYPE